MEKFGPQIYKGHAGPVEGELGGLLRDFSAQIVIGHPTFRNEATIGRQVREGLLGAIRNFPGKKVAIIVSDGSLCSANPDSRTQEAALSAAAAALNELPEEARKRLFVFAGPYEGYRGNTIPGKGSALKMVFDEMAHARAETLIMLDGDLRNDMADWQRVYAGVIDRHHRENPGREYFITARYARHFVDASLTRNIVGPLTTLMGTYVPGGISGDIVLSAGAAGLERQGPWSDARYRFGTDISTTFDNIAAGTIIYEVYLGAKLHDITDDAKLQVMPGEVIGATLERILHYEKIQGRISRLIREPEPLNHVITLDAADTGIGFIDPGPTDVFNLATKRQSLVRRFEEFAPALQKSLTPATFRFIGSARERLAEALVQNADEPLFLRFNSGRWIHCLHQILGYTLVTGDLENAKKSLNYLYTAAFLEFCREKLLELGLDTPAKIIAAQSSLGVPAAKAEAFYAENVDARVRRVAMEFYRDRGAILERAAGLMH